MKGYKAYVLILPMRNGNHTYLSFVNKQEGSYPTYEEWKHENGNPVSGSSLSSYPTYEEWKQNINFFLFYRIYCSYPTYEEWKHSNKISSVPWFIVLILPMRNGNSYEMNKLFSRQYRVLILPMRNGN